MTVRLSEQLSMLNSVFYDVEAVKHLIASELVRLLDVPDAAQDPTSLELKAGSRIKTEESECG